jgi:hypothetical protein
LLTGEGLEGGGGIGGVKSYDGEEAWSSKNNSILSGADLQGRPMKRNWSQSQVRNMFTVKKSSQNSNSE